MKINCLINTNNKQNQIIKLLLKKNYIYLETKDIFSKDSNKIIVIDIDTSIQDFEKFIKPIELKKNKILFFLPKKLENTNSSKNYEQIFYPIHVLDFEKHLKKFFLDNEKFLFKDIQLNYSGFLFNALNDKKIYLTDTEWQIVKILFKDKVVEKNTIKKNILNINSQIDTKSLESHISRIRKKFLSINANVNINSFDINKIKIN